MQSTTLQKQRILSIDVLRGIIMIIMALDHTRDFFSNVYFDPLDLTKTSPQLFLTRWITHFCAPVFVFLAGTSAFLSFSSGKTKKEASLFLLTRGLWLIFAEIAIINLAWSFDPTYTFVGVQVIWAIGWSMIFLAGFIFLKPIYVGIIGLVMIFGHNALDGIKSESFGSYKIVWMFLHEQNFIKYANDTRFFGVMYPIIPWVGVMATGFAFGTVFKMDAAKRKKWLLITACSCIALFIIIRYSNMYGDMKTWQPQNSWWKNILAFINCSKYPPSLLYLLMTLGPAMFCLILFEKWNNSLTRIFAVYGRVPFFYYVLHVVLIHGGAVLLSAVLGIKSSTFFEPSAQWGWSLRYVYLAWFIFVVLLYWPCKWFMHVKARRKDWWLSYL